MRPILNKRLLNKTFNSIKQYRNFTSSCEKPYHLTSSAYDRNRSARLELAAAYRGLDKLGLNEGVCNHLTVWAPLQNGEGEGMLVIPYGLHWSEVTASSLLALDKDGKILEGKGRPEISASMIHLGIRRIRKDATVIMHTHQPYATTIACLKNPELKMVHQNSARFYNRVSYDTEYSGLAHAIDEGERLGKALGDKDIMFMGNHGVISVSQMISVAFDNLYYLERAAQVQVLAESIQKPLMLLEDENAKKTSEETWVTAYDGADAHFYSMYRRLRKEQPDFEA